MLQELLGADVAEAKRKGKVRKALQGAGKGMMTLRQTVEQSDIVSLHCSLKDDTLHLINDKTISYFKKGEAKRECVRVNRSIRRSLGSHLPSSEAPLIHDSVHWSRVDHGPQSCSIVYACVQRHLLLLLQQRLTAPVRQHCVLACDRHRACMSQIRCSAILF